MEHITGLSLDYLGEKLHSTGYRYTEDELKGLLTRLLRILDYLHSRHIYHRDIKPGNILLTEEGTPVLIDFGAACPETSCRHRPDHPGVFLPGTGAGQNEYRPVERSLFRRGHFLRPAYRKSSGPRGSAPGGR